MTDPPAIGVRVLGPVRLFAGERELPVRPGQQKALLALLAVAGGRPVHRAELMAALWDGDPPAGAWNVVQTHVKRLRALLEPGRPGRSPSAALPRVGDGYALAVEPARVDLLRFRQLVEAARAAQRDHRAEDAFRLYRDGLALWHGRPFADVPVLADRLAADAVERERWSATGWQVDVALVLGRATDVVAQAEAAVEAVPLDERAAARLVRVYDAVDRPADAVAAYRAARRRLVEALGVEPGASLNNAYREVLRRDSYTPGLTGPARPAQLPPDIADFVGRAAQVAEVVAALDAGRDRARAARPPVVIAGMAGVGKTTFAVHIGHRLAGDFPDGQLYVALHGASGRPADPRRVLGSLLSALGVTGSAIPDSLDERGAMFRSRLRGRRVLLLLDDAAGTAQVRPLLPGTPSCAVLVTSRRRLGTLAGVHRTTLDVLNPDDAGQLLRRIVGEERCAAHPRAAAEILALCGWMPLAVRVAGARLATRDRWPLRELCARLADERSRLDELAADDLAVRASLGLSYATLAPPARRALRLLSLLDAADFAEWVPAALLDCPPRPADAQLEALLDTHLVVSAGTDPAAPPRYRLHDLVRLYAREQAEALDPPAVRAAAVTRTLAGLLGLAERADRELNCRYVTRLAGAAPRWPAPGAPGPDLGCDAATWFEAERVNLLAAVRQAADLGAAALAWNLADCAAGYYEMRDLRDDWRASHDLALAACRASGDGYGRAVLERNLGYLSTMAQRYDPSALRGHAEAAYALFERAGDDRGRAEALVLRGEADREQGRIVAAERLLDEAVALAHRAGEPLAESVALNEAAMTSRERGRIDEAVDRYRRSLRLSAEHGNIRPRYAALRFLGVHLARRGELDSARALLREALGLAEWMRSPVKQAMVLRELGVVEWRLGDPDAVSLLHAAHRLSRTAGHRIEEAYTVRNLALVDQAAGRPMRAAGRLVEALALLRGTRLVFFAATTRRDLGAALMAGGYPVAGRRQWRVARQLFLELGNDTEAAMLTG